MSSREAIVTALEALEVGDQALAVAILLGALERAPIDPKASTPCPVPNCTYTGWPGQVAHHLAISHGTLPTRSRRGSVRIHPPRRQGAADRTGREL